jgi:hypothetical protein
VIRFNEAAKTARIVVNHRPLRSVLLWSQLMGQHLAGTPYAQSLGRAQDLDLAADAGVLHHQPTEIQ